MTHVLYKQIVMQLDEAYVTMMALFQKYCSFTYIAYLWFNL